MLQSALHDVGWVECSHRQTKSSHHARQPDYLAKGTGKNANKQTSTRNHQVQDTQEEGREHAQLTCQISVGAGGTEVAQWSLGCQSVSLQNEMEDISQIAWYSWREARRVQEENTEHPPFNWSETEWHHYWSCSACALSKTSKTASLVGSQGRRKGWLGTQRGSWGSWGGSTSRCSWRKIIDNDRRGALVAWRAWGTWRGTGR